MVIVNNWSHILHWLGQLTVQNKWAHMAHNKGIDMAHNKGIDFTRNNFEKRVLLGLAIPKQWYWLVLIPLFPSVHHLFFLQMNEEETKSTGSTVVISSAATIPIYSRPYFLSKSIEWLWPVTLDELCLTWLHLLTFKLGVNIHVPELLLIYVSGFYDIVPWLYKLQ